MFHSSAKELFSYFLTEKLNIEKNELKALRTFRDEIYYASKAN